MINSNKLPCNDPDSVFIESVGMVGCGDETCGVKAVNDSSCIGCAVGVVDFEAGACGGTVVNTSLLTPAKKIQFIIMHAVREALL